MSAAGRPGAAERSRVGLCPDCRWMRRVTNGRGSVFVLCRRAASDPAFPRYPPLPRLTCAGYEPPPEGSGGSGGFRRPDHP